MTYIRHETITSQWFTWIININIHEYIHTNLKALNTSKHPSTARDLDKIPVTKVRDTHSVPLILPPPPLTQRCSFFQRRRGGWTRPPGGVHRWKARWHTLLDSVENAGSPPSDWCKTCSEPLRKWTGRIPSACAAYFRASGTGVDDNRGNMGEVVIYSV